jgi:hypothetical protein
MRTIRAYLLPSTETGRPSIQFEGTANEYKRARRTLLPALDRIGVRFVLLEITKPDGHSRIARDDAREYVRRHDLRNESARLLLDASPRI